MKYKCIKPLLLDRYDDNGFLEEENAMQIEIGEIFEVNDDCDYLLIADKPALRLENARRWIEIYPDTLAEHFEQIAERSENGK